MSRHLQTEENARPVIESYGEEKLNNMLQHLDDPIKSWGPIRGSSQFPSPTLLPRFILDPDRHFLFSARPAVVPYAACGSSLFFLCLNCVTDPLKHQS